MRRTSGEAAMRERLARAQADGELPPNLKPGDLARYGVTVLEGMSVQAAGGATCEQLLRVADMAMGIWPAHPIPAEKRQPEAVVQAEAVVL